MKTLTSIIALALVTASYCCSAEVVVVVHPSNGNSIDENTLKRIFLGKLKSFPDGSQVVPLNQKQESPICTEFDDKVLSKSSSQIKAYWSKLVFTGKGTPPKELDNDAAVIAQVASNPKAIGYIDAASVNDSVKIIGKF